MTDLPCGCPPTTNITNPQRHNQFHELVVKQGGPAGRVDAETLRLARGMVGGTPVGVLPYQARKAAE